MAKHSEKRGGRKVIRLEDHLPQHQATPAQEPPPPEEASPEEAPQATIEYGEEEAAGEEQKKARQVPKALYRVAVVLLVLVLGLAIWVNRANLTPQNIWNWIQVQITGTGEGDGYPVAITGSSVSEGNFLSAEGNAVALSDTALTILGPSGQELFSQRHSYNQPILKSASGQYLLYNQNSTGYMVVSGTQLHLESSTEQDILAGAIAPNGRFALATQGADGATDVTVYLATGEEQFTYSFAQDYVTALALNADGTWAMVCSVRAQGGQLVSKVTVFDLNSPTPAAEFESQDNLLLAAYWGENGMLYAVGDSALLRARSGELSFSEYGYQGRTPTAFQFNGGQCYLSLSAYEHAGACTLLVFRGLEEPVQAQAEERIVSLSVSGGTVGALLDQQLVLFDAATGQELARAEAGSDAKSIALSSESSAYVLGVSEIRRLQVR